MASDAITFEGLGIQASHSTTDTCLGKIRSFNSLSKREILFFILSLGSTLAVFGLTIERLATVDKNSADFTFAIVLFLNSCFCLHYILSGIFFERPFELGVLVLATSVVWLYLVLNYAISKKGPFKMARLIIASFLSPCVMVLGFLLAKNYHDSKNLIFRTVGARADLQDNCENMFLLYALLKADLQVTLSTALLILSSGARLNLEDEILLPIVLIISVVSFVLGIISVRFENRITSIVYATLWILMPVYAVYLIVKSAKDLHNLSDNAEAEKGILAVTFVAAGASLVVRVFVLYIGIKVFFNFGSGLKQKVYGIDEDTNANKGAKDAVHPDGNIQEVNPENNI